MTFSGAPTCSEAALGMLGASIALSLGYSAMRGAERLMVKWDIPIEDSFTFFRFYSALEKISEPFFRSLVKAVSLIYVIILTPIIEEWVFRGLIYKWQSPDEIKMDTWVHKTYRIFANAAIFGAYHIHPLHGWINIPIFAVSTLSGVVFATLREITQNTWASTIAHSLNNTFVVFITLKI